jgi:hypothetical protein
MVAFRQVLDEPSNLTPSTPDNRALEGRAALVTGASSGLGRGPGCSSAALAPCWKTRRPMARETYRELPGTGAKRFAEV